MWVKSSHHFIESVFAFGPNIPTLHHFFLGRMYLKIVFAKQGPFCWAFVLSEILIKDLGQRHTSYFHIPRRDGHAHRPDCQSLQDGLLRGREDLRESGEVHLQGRSWRGNGMRWWDDKLPIDCDNIMVRPWLWCDYDIDRSWMGTGYQEMKSVSVLFEEEKTIMVNKTMSQLRNVFDGDMQLETLHLIERTMKAAIKLEKAHRAWDCWSLCMWSRRAVVSFMWDLG